MSSLGLFDESTRILVPVTLPDPEPLAPWLIEFLKPLDVYVVGCYQVKDQTSPEQAREQFEDEASSTLDQVVDEFMKGGNQVTSNLVFTRDVVETIDRLSEEHNIDVVISPMAVERISSLLAVVTDDLYLDRLQDCISALLEDSEVSVTLLHVAENGAEESEKDEKGILLDGLKQRLVDDGLAESRVETRALEAEAPADCIVDTSEQFDVVIMSETQKTLRDRLLREAPSPVIVVRSRPDEE